MPYGPSLSYPSTCHVSFGPWLKYVLRRSRCCCLSATPTGSICRSISLTVMCDTRKWCFCTSSRHIVRYPPSLPVHTQYLVVSWSFFSVIFFTPLENVMQIQNKMQCHVMYKFQYTPCSTVLDCVCSSESWLGVGYSCYAMHAFWNSLHCKQKHFCSTNQHCNADRHLGGVTEQKHIPDITTLC